MAFTLAQLDALEEAIALGATSVQYGDKKIIYNSITEMMKLREIMRRALGIVEPGVSRIYPITGKGLDGGSDE